MIQPQSRYDIDAPGRFPADFVQRCALAADRDWPLVIGVSGPFWQLREWWGFEGLCMLMIDDPDFVAEMDMAREFCMPSWKAWTRQVMDAGCPTVDIDSDGYIGELIPLWIESGVNVCNPIEVAAHCDIVEFRQTFGKNIAYRGGVDKRCIARGGQALTDELKRLAPVIRDGGFIPSCDHGIPADVSWNNYLDYCRQLAELTGWL